jgi:hypothetical protein
MFNIGPNAVWKVKKAREKTSLPFVHRKYPITQSEANNDSYDEGAAILNGLQSIVFECELSDQEMFEFYSMWHNLRK